mmetsp:Transcript_54216/g.129191  ORF Transcript_54216/g.129191 Transcript_54216/m.129191 type:complete len:945 (+) Transcript_54216:92-2926(+)
MGSACHGQLQPAVRETARIDTTNVTEFRFPSKDGKAGGSPEESSSAADLFQGYEEARRSCYQRNLPPGAIIEFLTDVEGNWEYFMRWVERSDALDWAGVERGPWGPGTLVLKDDYYLVFGGDAPDKGPGDIRFVKTLLYLKLKYPDRVFIILGNRDINKLRFAAELEQDAAPLHPLPWDVKAMSLEAWLDAEHLTPSRVNTLKWMLHFMGCQKTTFATRKHELALLDPNVVVDDEAVVDSFVESVHPSSRDPWMLRLLKMGHLALVLDDTLFVHCGMHDAALNHVPGKAEPAKSLEHWCIELEFWKEHQLEEFVKSPHWYPAEGGRRRGADDLILYGTPGYPDEATICYYNPFASGNPQLRSAKVEDYLTESGINRVLSGHQPHGQSPTVVRHPRTGLLCVTADTSYSDPAAEKLFNKANMRGHVVSLVRIHKDTVHISGVLADGTEHECNLRSDPDDDEMPDGLVGRQLTDNSWVKTVITQGDGTETRRQFGHRSSRNFVIGVVGEGPPRFNLKTQKMHYGKAALMLKPDFMRKDLVPLEPGAEGQSRKSLGSSHLGELQAHWMVSSTTSMEAQIHDEEVSRALASSKAFGMMNPSDYEFSADEFADAETYIFSITGTIDKAHDESGERDPEVVQREVVERINQLIARKKRVVFASNNSQKSRAEVGHHLISKGIHLQKDIVKGQVLNTAFTCAWFLKRIGRTRPFIICSKTGLLEELEGLGINNYVATITRDGKPRPEFLRNATLENVLDCVRMAPDVDCVVIGWDECLTTLKVCVAAAYVHWKGEGLLGSVSDADLAKSKQVPVVTCSTDSYGVLGNTPQDFQVKHKYQGRSVGIPGNGLMAQIVCRTVSGTASAFDVGKPSELMLESLRRPQEEQGYGVDTSRAIMIGDTLETDIEMANKGGMRSLLVLSGQTQRRNLHNQHFKSVPTWILGDFGKATIL